MSLSDLTTTTGNGWIDFLLMFMAVWCVCDFGWKTLIERRIDRLEKRK